MNGNQITITTLPTSKNTVFNVDDFHELVQIVTDHLDMTEEEIEGKLQNNCSNKTTKKTEEKGKNLIHKQIMRPKKVYQMLASRACRSSIMVGRALDAKTMRKVVSNLTTLESPWNCPHGRPTLRYLK